MELASLLVVLALAVIAAVFIARPLVEGRAREPSAAERRLSALRAEQDQILALLHELDMDYAMGKIEPGDYEAQRSARMSQGAALLREIDSLEKEAAAAGPPPTAADLEASVAELRTRAAGFCGRCGNPLVIEDRFCSRCGQPVPGSSA
ncbi:MAG TPA: zinc ribbon domain-containing protein [Anaerolineales bacterium]|nr:zinc ribbon domain-containing protein [Anaerolineales bacterium]